MNVRMPDGVIIQNVPDGTPKDVLLAKYSARKQPSPSMAAPSGAASSPPPEEPSSGIGSTLKNIGTGAAYAAGDIPAGIVQMGSRYLPFLSPETRAAGEARVNRYTAKRERDIESPGGKIGYYGTQLATAFLPVGSGAMAAVRGGSRLGTLAKTVTSGANAARAAKFIAPGVAQAALQPYETEGERGTQTALAAGIGLGAPAATVGVSKIFGKLGGLFRQGAPAPGGSEEAIRRSIRKLKGAPGSKEAGRLLESAHRLGVTITPGQVSGPGLAKSLEEQAIKLPGSRKIARSFENKARESFHRAIAKEIGVDLGDDPYIFSGTVEDARKKIGATLGEIWGKVRVDAGTQEANQIQAAALGLSDPFAALVKSTIPPKSLKALENISTSVSDALATEGALAGNGISALRTHLRELSENPKLHASVRKRVSGFETQLESMAQASLEKTDPTLFEQLTRANHQYANSKILEKAVGDVEGFVSGPKLYAEIIRKYKDPSVAGDFGELTKIGKKFFQTLPDSGTADRVLANNLLTGAAVTGGLTGGLSGLAAVMITPKVLAHAYYSTPGFQKVLRGAAKFSRAGGRVGAVVPGTVPNTQSQKGGREGRP